MVRRRNLVQPEKKFFDVALGNTSIATTGTVYVSSINKVTQGNGESQMLGKKITIKSIQIRLRAIAPYDEDVIGAIESTGTVRVCLFLDKQCNGAAATIADVFETATALGMLNMENSKRFRLLKEWIITINQNIGSYYQGGQVVDAAPASKYVKFYKKCNIRIDFSPEASAGTRAITEIKSNNLFMMAFSQDKTINLNGRSRIRYCDD